MEQNKIVTYYVIKDLATWTTHGCKQSVCERYEHAEEAMQQFRDYAQWQTVIEDKRIRATLGIRIKGLDFDVVYRIGGKNALSLEFHLSSSVNEDQNFLVALQNICQQLPVSHVRIHRQMTEEEKKEWTRERFTKWVLLNNVHGIIQDLEKKFEPLYEQQKLESFLPTRQQQYVVEHMSLGAWDNPYFEALPPEHFALFVQSQSLYVCMQTSESEFDYTLYDSQEHIEYISDYTLLMKNGRLILTGKTQDLALSLEGKVWKIQIPEKQLEQVNDRYIVVNIHREEAGMIDVRVVSDEKPSVDAIMKKATLEDLYLFHFRENQNDVGW